MNPLIDLLKEYAMAYSLGVLRLTVAFTILPLTGPAVIPGMSRIIAFASMSLVIVPHVQARLPSPMPGSLAMMPIFLKEAFIGILIGYFASLIFWMAEAVGFFIDNQRGSSMASAFDPTTGGESSPLGILIAKAVTTLFFVTGGFLSLLTVIYQSYLVWPVFEFLPVLKGDFPIFMLKVFDGWIRSAALYAAPLMLLLFFAEFGLGLMNRFAQQLNVFVLAMPVKSGLAMFLFVIYMSYLLHYFKVEFLKIPEILKDLEIMFF